MDMDFCMRSSSVWQIVGYALFVLKVLIPVVIIIFGIIDLVKALTANKDDAINSAAKSILMRVIVGIVIFFVPTIIRTVLRLVNEASPYLSKASACEECLLGPMGDKCKGSISEAKRIREEKHKKQQEDGGYGEGVAISGCYFCGNTFTWTNNPTLGCEKVYRDLYTDTIVTESMCNEFNNDPKRAGFTNTAQIGAEDDDGGSGSSGSSANKGNVIYLGDSIMYGMCTYKSINKDAGCYYGGGMALPWLNGTFKPTTNDSINSSSPVSEITTLIKNNSSKKYIIAVLMGVNDIAGDNNPESHAQSYVSFYSTLAQNDWKNASIKVISLNPVSDACVYSVNNDKINKFNSALENGISNLRLSNVKFCKTNLKQSDFDYYANDGLHFDKKGRENLYNAIQKCL